MATSNQLNPIEISTTDVAVIPSSLVDPVGLVFEHNGGIYRGIRENFVEYYRMLFASGDAAKLIELGLSNTRIADLAMQSFPLVLEHDRIPFVTYPPEWPGALLAKAAVFLCELELNAAQLGYSIKDGHPWNIMFQGMQPVFVDWGSVVTTGPTAVFFEEVKNWILFPLFLKSVGMHDVARSFLMNVHHRPLGTPEGHYLASRRLTGRWYQRLLHRAPNMQSFYDWIAPIDRQKNYARQLRETVRLVETLPIHAAHTEWASYPGAESTQDLDEPSSWNTKTKNVHKWLQRTSPKTVVDIGCNRGWYSLLASRLGAKVLALDVDETSLNTLCENERANRDVTAAFFDLAAPTPSHGVGGMLPAALDRNPADLVLALAITHHLVFKRSMPFSAIADSLAKQTNATGTAIVEFVPREDVHVRAWDTSSQPSYNLDNFKAELEKRFARVSVEDSNASPRVLCVCQK